MQKKKNILLSISLAVLVLACFGVYYLNSYGAGPVDKNLFHVDDFTAVDRVVMTGPQGRVDLRTTGGRWRVNDEFVADPNLIDVLFATLRQAEPKRPVAARLRDSVSHHLDTQGTRVELYEGDQVAMAFIAGGNSARTEAHFKEADADTPYIMVIPGYRVYVSGIFELSPAGWRDRYVFGFNWMNFVELEASFPGDPESGFSVTRENKSVSIAGMAEADTTRLNDFLDAVSLLSAQEFTETVPDTLRESEPIMRIVVKDVANRQYSLELYNRNGTDGPYQGIVDSTSHALFDARHVEEILRPKAYFRP